MQVKIVVIATGNLSGKKAEAELHFTMVDGPLAGLKLVGFAVWESRGKYNVTFPARAYSVSGERRSYALLRPIKDPLAQNQIRNMILEEYEAVLETTGGDVHEEV